MRFAPASRMIPDEIIVSAFQRRRANVGPLVEEGKAIPALICL